MDDCFGQKSVVVPELFAFEIFLGDCKPAWELATLLGETRFYLSKLHDQIHQMGEATFRLCIRKPVCQWATVGNWNWQLRYRNILSQRIVQLLLPGSHVAFDLSFNLEGMSETSKYTTTPLEQVDFPHLVSLFEAWRASGSCAAATAGLKLINTYNHQPLLYVHWGQRISQHELRYLC